MVSYSGVVGMLTLTKAWSSTLRVPLIVLTPVALFIGCATSDDVSSLELRAQEINRTIMCPVCPGESIDQSQHPLAVQMRAIVDDRLGEGWSGSQIQQFFVDRYGPSVRLDPTSDGTNILIWVVPPVGIALAALALYFVLRRMRSDGVGLQEEPAPAALTDDERQRYFNRIEEALQGDDGKGEGAT